MTDEQKEAVGGERLVPIPESMATTLVCAFRALQVLINHAAAGQAINDWEVRDLALESGLIELRPANDADIADGVSPDAMLTHYSPAAMAVISCFDVPPVADEAAPPDEAAEAAQ